MLCQCFWRRKWSHDDDNNSTTVQRMCSREHLFVLSHASTARSSSDRATGALHVCLRQLRPHFLLEYLPCRLSPLPDVLESSMKFARTNHSTLLLYSLCGKQIITHMHTMFTPHAQRKLTPSGRCESVGAHNRPTQSS